MSGLDQLSAAGLQPFTQEGPSRGVVTTTKRVTSVLGGDGFLDIAPQALDIVNRYLIRVPVTTTRWRLRIANRKVVSNSAYAGAIFLNGCVIGDPLLSASLAPQDRWGGQFASAPALAIGATTLATDGSDFATAWVSDPALQFTKGVQKAISFGVNSNGVNVAWSYDNNSCPQSWWNGGAAATFANTGAPSGTNVFHHPLDIRLEYEFSSPNAAPIPVTLFVGDSIMSYVSATPANGIGPHERWPGAASLRAGSPWINLAVAGAPATDWAATNTSRWTRADLATTVPDRAVIGLLTNDIFLGTTVAATLEASLKTVIANVRAFGIGEIYLATIPPRNFAGASETARTTLNNYMGTVPVGVAGVVDIDKALAVQAAPATMDADYVATAGAPYTDPHLTLRGHQRAASASLIG